jgi:hypothetical protein
MVRVVEVRERRSRAKRMLSLPTEESDSDLPDHVDDTESSDDNDIPPPV